MNIWLTSFWGFDPANWGCLAFSSDRLRGIFQSRAAKGDLIVVYITKAEGPDHMRGKVVGVMEVSERRGPAEKFASGDAWARKEADPKSRGKWTFGVEALRAWNIVPEDWVAVDELLPRTYANNNKQLIGSQCVAVEAEEAKNLLGLHVIETPVYGQSNGIAPAIQSLENILAPSKAVLPASEPYWVGETDGPKHLYVLELDGDMGAYLGRPKEVIGSNRIVKVGFSRSPLSRCAQIQSAYPVGQFKWRVLKPEVVPTVPPYSCASVAIAGEDAMKAKMVELGAESLGGEFFLADAGVVQQVWGAGIVAALARQKNS